MDLYLVCFFHHVDLYECLSLKQMKLPETRYPSAFLHIFSRDWPSNFLWCHKSCPASSNQLYFFLCELRWPTWLWGGGGARPPIVFGVNVVDARMPLFANRSLHCAVKERRDQTLEVWGFIPVFGAVVFRWDCGGGQVGSATCHRSSYMLACLNCWCFSVVQRSLLWGFVTSALCIIYSIYIDYCSCQGLESCFVFALYANIVLKAAFGPLGRAELNKLST